MIDEALILAAGKGTRMWPLTEFMPKPLLPLCGKPIIEQQIIALKKVGVQKVHILIGHRMKEISDYLGNGKKYNVKINYIIQNEQKGTGHAVSLAKKHIDGDFYCLNGDTVIDEINLNLLKQNKNGMAMMITSVEDGSAFGVVKCKGGILEAIIEKGVAGEASINAGIYLFSPKIFDAIKKIKKSIRGELELTDAIVSCKIKTIEYKGFWKDIGAPWDLITANETMINEISNEKLGVIEDNVTIKGALYLGENSLIKSGTYIEGPVWIGPDAIVGPNACIRGATMLGTGAKVGAASEVKNSILMEHSKAPHHNYVGDSILGRNCNLGSGTKIANLRHDGASIYVIIRGERVDSGLRKLGVILGDDVKTGINASLNVGTILGEETVVGPGRVVSGSWAAGSRIL